MTPVIGFTLRKACGLTAAAGLLLGACSAPDSSLEKPPKPAIVVRAAESGTQLSVYPGEVRARHEPALAFRVAGAVTERLVEVGDRVKQGQPLAQLDAQNLLLQRESAHAQLAAAQAAHRNATSEMTRYRELFARKLVGESQFEAVQTRLDSTLSELKRARAQLEIADNQAGYATLKAPRDGVIARRMIDAGQVVSAGQAVFTLAAYGEQEIRIDLPEQEISRFAVGQAVTVELWSRPGTPFPGQIRELSPAADANLRTFEARVAFDNSTLRAELGQSARVYIQGSDSRRTLRVPMSAVSADSDKAHVWALNGETFTLHKIPVTVARYGAEDADILAALKPGDWVLAAGTQLVREGLRVRPVDRQNRPIELDIDVAQSP